MRGLSGLGKLRAAACQFLLCELQGTRQVVVPLRGNEVTKLGFAHRFEARQDRVLVGCGLRGVHGHDLWHSPSTPQRSADIDRTMTPRTSTKKRPGPGRPNDLPNRHLLLGCALFMVACGGSAASTVAVGPDFPDDGPDASPPLPREKLGELPSQETAAILLVDRDAVYVAAYRESPAANQCLVTAHWLRFAKDGSGGRDLGSAGTCLFSDTPAVLVNGNLYWTSTTVRDPSNKKIPSGIMSMPASGGVARAIAQTDQRLQSLTTDGAYLYTISLNTLGDGYADSVIRAPIAGGDFAPVASALTRPNNLAIDGVDIIVSSDDCGSKTCANPTTTFWRIPVGGGVHEKLRADRLFLSTSASIWVGDRLIFVKSAVSDWSLQSLSREGVEATLVDSAPADTEGPPAEFHFVGGKLIATYLGQDSIPRLVGLPRPTPEGDGPYTDDTVDSIAIAADDAFAYFIQGGSVFRVAIP